MADAAEIVADGAAERDEVMADSVARAAEMGAVVMRSADATVTEILRRAAVASAAGLGEQKRAVVRQVKREAEAVAAGVVPDRRVSRDDVDVAKARRTEGRERAYRIAVQLGPVVDGQLPR